MTYTKFEFVDEKTKNKMKGNGWKVHKEKEGFGMLKTRKISKNKVKDLKNEETIMCECKDFYELGETTIVWSRGDKKTKESNGWIFLMPVKLFVMKKECSD